VGLREFHDESVISSRLPHSEQQKSCAAWLATEPQPMQRNRNVAWPGSEPFSEVVDEGMDERLFLATQVLVSLVDPIGARRIENIQVYRVFERLSFVRHVSGDAENFAGVNHNLSPVDPELQRTVQDVRELLVVVAVLGDHAAFFQQHPRHHNLLTDDELPLQERVQIFERNRVPGNVLKLGLAGRMFRNGALSASVICVLCLSAGGSFGF
jgi:hypothetical protein